MKYDDDLRTPTVRAGRGSREVETGLIPQLTLLSCNANAWKEGMMNNSALSKEVTR